MNRRAFTLIELVLATAGCAMLLAAIFGFFSRAVHLRDEAMARSRESRLRARAASVIRNDLRNAIVSGGTLAATLEGSQQGPGGSFPGYLKFTTTTAPDVDEVPDSDIQQVEYYIVADPDAADQNAGRLVRACNRNLLATTNEPPTQEPLLAGVASMEVSFFDGSSWQDSWQVTADNKKLPEAVRVRIRPARAEANAQAAAPIEVLVPWMTEAANETTAATTTSGGKP
jgi:type II secretion system protein J